MDTITAIRTLRVVRTYAPQPLTEEEVRAIADTARKTGSSKNTQRWDFVTVRDRGHWQRLSGVTIYAKHLPSAGAAIALIVDAPEPGPRPLGAVGPGPRRPEHHARGLGDGHRLVPHHGAGLRPGGGCAGPARTTSSASTSSRLGWPADPDDLTRPPQAGGRKSYDEVVHSERWGQ